MHLKHCYQNVVPTCCLWPLRTVPFPLSTTSKPNATRWISSSSQLPPGALLGSHQETNTDCPWQISSLGVGMMKMSISVGWCWNQDCETPKFLTRKSAEISEKPALWLHSHLEAEWQRAAGLTSGHFIQDHLPSWLHRTENRAVVWWRHCQALWSRLLEGMGPSESGF